MPRSGSTVHYQLTKEIVESNNVGKGLGWVEPEQFPKLQSNFMNDNRFLVIKCHSYINGAQDLVSRGEAKAIYVYRDLRDVIVSIMNKNKTSFRHVMQSGFIHSILQEYDNWNKLNDIFVAKYENMIKDLAQETLKIAKYIGVDLDKSSAVKIAGKYTIEQQVKRIQSFDYNTYGVRAGKNNYDPDFLLHDNHIFSGNTKQWITMLSPFEIGLIEDIAYGWLVEKDYHIKQTWIIRKIAVLSYGLINFYHPLGYYFKRIVGRLMKR
ncbi:MAG: sulfotransferase domain-containing protein [Desulfobacterales bacterium]|uniref:Sulfotransferase domain-containing protein n=1 Tax=Candidatus Desulfatibia vada TaxID=2841696 RepID=A0A8J6NZL6_9BACT|nr:sulfotransferase domain-containing protein [Candidatus Desulfatibia vada]